MAILTAADFLIPATIAGFPAIGWPAHFERFSLLKSWLDFRLIGAKSGCAAAKANMSPWIRKTVQLRGKDLAASLSVVGFFILAGCFFCNLLVHEVILRAAQNRLQDFCQDSIARSINITEIATQELAHMNRSSQERCSPQNMATLRELVFRIGILQDAGWFKGDQIRCSSQVQQASQGASDLDLIAKAKNNILIYRSDHRFSIQQKPTILMRMGDAYVNVGVLGQEFSGPSWVDFSTTIADMRGFYAGIPDPQSAWIYTSAGKYRHNGRVFATACSSQYKLCHTAAIPIHLLYERGYAPSRVGIAFGAGIGGLLGATVLLLYQRRRTRESQLERAISKSSLYLEYQPIVQISTGQIVGAEALCRWKDKDGLQVSPEEFIPMAEKKLWIGDLTRLVFSLALQDCGALLRQNSNFTLSINLSPRCLRMPELMLELQQMLNAHGIRPSAIALEITESAAAHDLELIAQIQALRAMGHPIHLDDFGTGYSSLSYLHELRMDAIKIDRSFMRAIGTHSIEVDILPQILSIAQTLHLAVIVEGIETVEQEAYLAAISDTLLGQGWLYGRPIHPSQFAAMLASQPLPALKKQLQIEAVHHPVA